MNYTEAQQGRIFILRLEQNDPLPKTIETFAANKNIRAAMVYLLGGADQNSRLISGPTAEEDPHQPVGVHRVTLEDVHDMLGVGTLFPDENDSPILHLHASCGHDTKSVTGCIREGIHVWVYMEVIVIELLHCHAHRHVDPKTGFTLLKVT